MLEDCIISCSKNGTGPMQTLQVTSSAKRRRRPGSNALAQTPDGSFRDLMANARDLLLNHCGFSSVPEVCCPWHLLGKLPLSISADSCKAGLA
jgi:hypothetical protein